MLAEWQYQALEAAAERLSVSISQLVREILTRHLAGARGASKLRDVEGGRPMPRVERATTTSSCAGGAGRTVVEPVCVDTSGWIFVDADFEREGFVAVPGR